MRIQTLYIMQGIPGSGKSFLAARIPGTICSTDSFFMEQGQYVFRPEKLSMNHRKNIEWATSLLNQGCDVIVDNTNIKKEHAKPYVDAAKAVGAKIVIIRVHGQFENSHGVPPHVIERMKKDMEDLSELL